MSITDRVNTDARLDRVTVDDHRSQVLMPFEVVPVLLTPAAAVAGLVTAGVAVEEAADK